MTRQLDLTVQGVVGTNPVLSRVGDNARPYCRFRVAVTPTYRTEQGWNNAETIWFTAKAWGQLAANLSHSLRKGDAVLLTGRFSQESWESNGRKHETNVITLQAAGHDLTRGSPASRASEPRSRRHRPPPGREPVMPSSSPVARSASRRITGRLRWRPQMPQLHRSQDSQPSRSLQSPLSPLSPPTPLNPAGGGGSDMRHVESSESFVIDPACARTEDQTGEPWPVYELADDLVEQAVGVS